MKPDFLDVGTDFFLLNFPTVSLVYAPYMQISQAERIFRKYRPIDVAADLGLTPSAVYQWALEYGTNGFVPSHYLTKIIACARLRGILLTDDDVSPLPHEDTDL